MQHAGDVDDLIDTQMHVRHRRFLLTALRARLANAALTLIARARERRALAALDGRLLRDVGIDRLDAVNEATKPLWRR